MVITILPHAKESVEDRGASEQEVILAVESGEMIPAKIGRSRYVKNFSFGALWKG